MSCVVSNRDFKCIPSFYVRPHQVFGNRDMNDMSSMHPQSVVQDLKVALTPANDQRSVVCDITGAGFNVTEAPHSTIVS